MEDAEEGGLPIEDACDGLDTSVPLLGCCEDGGDVCEYFAPPYDPPTSPSDPYLAGKLESLLFIDSGDPAAPALFIAKRGCR